MIRFSPSRIGRRLVGVTLAVSVVAAIAQGSLDDDPAAHAATAELAVAAIDQLVAAASEATDIEAAPNTTGQADR